MAEKRVGKAVLELELDSKQYAAGMREIAKHSDDAAKRLRGIGQAVDLAVFQKLATIGASAVKGLVSGIAELGVRGAGIDDVASSFGTLTEAIGSTSDAMLTRLREGVKGTLSDVDLMALSNKALGAELLSSAEDAGVLAAGARQLAKTVGGDTKTAFDTLLTAIASGRTAQLKQLGLFVDSKVATENFAKAHGKTVAQLTDAERAQALSAATVQALSERLQAIPPAAADFGELIEAAKVRVTNFTDGLAVGISRSPVFASAMTTMGAALDSAMGARQSEAISTLVGIIEDVAIKATYVGQAGVIAAEVFGRAWQGLKALILAAISAIVVTPLEGISKLISGIAELGTHIPLIGEKVQGFAAGSASLATTIADVNRGLVVQATDAAKAAVGGDAFTATTDRLNATLVTMRDNMTSAASATRDVGTTATTAATSVGALATATGTLSEAQKKAAAEAAQKLREATLQRITDIQTLTTKIAEAEQERALAQATGLQRRLLEIDYAQKAELASIAHLATASKALHDDLTAHVLAKYEAQRKAASEAATSVAARAAEAGFQTRAALEATAARAIQLYNDMKASGEYSAKQLQDAWEKAEEAKREAAGITVSAAQEGFGAILESGTDSLRTLFGRNKAAAIAQTIADTAAAVITTFKNNGGWPWGIIPAGLMAAAGAKRVAEIRSTDAGFREGTPRLDFASFGREFPTMLHDDEAVIPRGGGHQLAREIADAMPGDQDTAREIQGLRGEMRDMLSRIERNTAEGTKVHMDGQLVGNAIGRRIERGGATELVTAIGRRSSRQAPRQAR